MKVLDLDRFHFKFVIVFRFYTQKVIDIYKKTYIFDFFARKSHLIHCTHHIQRRRDRLCKIEVLPLSDVTV